MGSSKKSTIAFKQMLGAHWLWTLGPIDKLVRLMFGEDKRVAWQGEQAESGTIIVDAENLFGGKKKEGGVSGAVDVEFGDSAQGRNAYLQSQLGNDIPAYRGLLGLVFRGISSGGFYFGTNPYLKKVSILAQRIHVRQDGIAQWYDEKAEVPGESGEFTSSWDFSQLSYNSESSPDVRLNARDLWVSDDESKVFSITPSIDSSMYSWEMTTPGDLSTLSFTGSKSSVGSDPSGVFVKPDGLSAFVFSKTAPGFRAFSMSSAFDASTAVEVGNYTGVGPGHYGCHFRDDGLYFYNCLGTTVNQWLLTVPWAPHGGMTLVHTFSMSGVTSSTLKGISGSPDGSRIFVTNDSAEDHGWQLSISDVDDISTATIVNLLNPLVDIDDSFHIISNGTQLYSIDESADVIYKYDFSGYFISGDINPAHFIRETLTDPDWGRGLPEADMGDSFTTAADTFHAEGMGISIRWDRQMSIEEFVEVLLSHADAALYEDRTTGKFELKPIRADYDPDLLDVLDKSVISKLDKPNWRVFGDLPTAVTVVYTDPDNGDDASVTHSNPALAAMQGKEKETTLQYPGFRRADLAARIAARDSRALGSEIFTTDLIGSRALLDYNAGDAVKLNWPEYGISNMIMRVIQGPKVEGRNKIRLAVSTDVYALPDLAPVATPEGEWVDPSQPPAATTLHIAVEAPYYELVQRNGEAATDAIIAENQDLGYLLATAVRPAYAINASIYVDAGAGYEDSGVVDFCPYAELSAAVGPADTVWAIAGGIDLDQVRIGSHAEVNGELFRVDAISAGEDQLTVGRGVLDTVPAPAHAVGSSIFFWDDYAEGDGTEYVTAESIDVKVVPQSGAGASDLADITADTVLMAARAFRPYPPGNLLIDAFAYPDSVSTASFTATVAHRDRTQQTSGTLQDTTYGNIGPEVGVTYTWTLYRTDTEAVLQSYSGDSVTSKAFAPGYDGEVRLEVKAVRDGEDSWQPLTHTFQLGSTFNRITETGDARITETGDIRITE